MAPLPPFKFGERAISLGGVTFQQPLIQGPRNPQLSATPGHSITLIGGGIELEGGQVSTFDGNIGLWSVTAGELALSGTQISTQVEPESQAIQWGDITLDRYALLETTVAESNVLEASRQMGGNIVLRGDRINILGSSLVNGQAAGDASGKELDVSARHSLRVAGFDPVRQFSSTLIGQSLGTGPGPSVSVEAPSVAVQDGSRIATITLGEGRAGDLSIRAGDIVEVGVIQGEGLPVSGIITTTYGNGDAGNSDVKTTKLEIKNGGSISSNSFGAGESGDITVTARESVRVDGILPLTPDAFSGITTIAFNRGAAGDVDITTGQLQVSGGGTISSSAIASTLSIGQPLPGAGEGNGGNLTIQASESIRIEGENALIDAASSIGSSTLGKGNAGTTVIRTPRLSVLDGGLVNSSTIANGDAGELSIVAEHIEVVGRDPRTQRPSQIASSAREQPLFVRQAFFLPELPAGNTGALNIRAQQIRVRDGGEISTQHQGSGNAGNLNIEAEQLTLNRGTILAATFSGQGGELRLNLSEAIALQSGSSISAEALGGGNGGNIELTTPLLILDKSTIVANAIAGNGGNIGIFSQGLFQSSSRINASSQLGIDGTVEIRTPDLSPAQALVVLPESPTTANEQPIANCTGFHEDLLATSGRGGLPINPLHPLSSPIFWKESRLTSPLSQSFRLKQLETQIFSGRRAPEEAIAAKVLSNGRVRLFSIKTTHTPQLDRSCFIRRHQQSNDS